MRKNCSHVQLAENNGLGCYSHHLFDINLHNQLQGNEEDIVYTYLGLLIRPN